MVTFVLLLVSIVLVLVGVATLIIGIFSDTLAWVFVSIGSTLAAGIVLYILNRLGRRAPAPVQARPLTVSDEAVASAAGVSERSMPAPASAPTEIAEEYAPVVTTVEVDIFPIDEYDELRVSEILPLLPQLDPDELEVVRDREATGKSRDSILSRIDELLLGEDAVASTTGGFDLPIADYDELTVGEIVPLLSELDAEELELVAEHEQRGANRASILTRIDTRLLGLDGAGVAKKAPAKRAPAAKKAPAKKAPAASAPAKTAPATKAPAKKAPATKAPAKKAPAATKAAASKAPAKKAPAASAPAKKAPATKAAAAKAPAKKAPAASAPAKKAAPAAKKMPAAKKAAPAPAKKAPATKRS